MLLIQSTITAAPMLCEFFKSLYSSQDYKRIIRPTLVAVERITAALFKTV